MNIRLSWKSDALDKRSKAAIRPQDVEGRVFAGFIKIPSRWGVKTAPYFHDNSAKTLEEVAAFYTNLFANNPDFPVSSRSRTSDMVACLRLVLRSRG